MGKEKVVQIRALHNDHHQAFTEEEDVECLVWSSIQFRLILSIFRFLLKTLGRDRSLRLEVVAELSR